MHNRTVYYTDHIEAHFGDGSKKLAERDAAMRRRSQTFLATEYLIDPKTGRRNLPQPRVLGHPYCNYCNGILRFFGQPDNEPFRGDQSFVGECETCGWWFCQSMHYRSADHDYTHNDYYEGVLRNFDITHLDLPVAMLRQYLQKRFDDIRNLHPRKFEELCCDVFREHFDCEVRLTSYSRDGGVDLYLIDGEQPCVVQLKRRHNPAAEPVEAVREFLGAMLEHGALRGLYVSTAERYTSGAKRATKSSHLAKLGMRLDLIDYNGLRELFTERGCEHKPWKLIRAVRTPELYFSSEVEPRRPRFPW